MKNKVAIVTGGGSGIGRATAIELASRGALVIVSDIIEENAKSVADEIIAVGGKSCFVRTDVSNRGDIDSLITTCAHNHGSIDILVNNAGIGGPLSFFDQITDDDYHQIMRVNVDGVFYGMRAALKIMKAQKSGTIVNTASLAGIGAAPRMGAYAASKHAVVGMTKTAATEYGKYGIRINAVCPTVIKTPMGEDYIDSDDSVVDYVLNTIPMKRFGEASEVAKTIAWLASDESSFINGETVRVDGGHVA